MDRRRLLATVGTAVVATAGCLTDPPADTDTTDSTQSTDEPADGPATTSPDGTAEMSPDDDRFADVPCPSFSKADRTNCWHTVDPASASVYLEPDSELLAETNDDVVETLSFVLHNETGGDFGLNPHAWSIYRRTDGEWTRVAPDEYIEPWYTLADGETYTWRVSLEPHPSPNADDELDVVQPLEDGTYAFHVSGHVESGPDEGTAIECIALFAVQRAGSNG